jgi:hypothetical protein
MINNIFFYKNFKMGTCKTNCCAERFMSYSLEDNQVETNARDNKSKKSDGGKIKDDEEELPEAQSN